MPFGLYLHFPFCFNRCSYCDFYKELFSSDIEKQYFDALKIETELCAKEYANSDREISTIFIGGGTPSLANLDLFKEWLDQLRKYFIVPNGIEFSIENNPESVTREKLAAFKELGVNRPVLGIQSFNRKLLNLLNRNHNPDDSYQAINLMNTLGYGNFGVDLIFGLPGQTSKMLSMDLDEIVDLEPPHISFYQLTIEQGTELAEKVESGKIVVPSQEVMLSLYKGGCERLTEAGYIRYEVSSFAKPGYECQHNIGYWEGKDYLGLGPSAHSFMFGKRFENVPDVGEYIKALSQGQRSITYDESGIEERMVEAIMLGLRTVKGIDRHKFSARFGNTVESRLDQVQYDLFIKSGHVISDDDSIRLTDEGICVADEIIRRLIK